MDLNKTKATHVGPPKRRYSEISASMDRIASASFTNFSINHKRKNMGGEPLNKRIRQSSNGTKDNKLAIASSSVPVTGDTPVIQKRGRGRPRKDSYINVTATAPPISISATSSVSVTPQVSLKSSVSATPQASAASSVCHTRQVSATSSSIAGTSPLSANTSAKIKPVLIKRGPGRPPKSSDEIMSGFRIFLNEKRKGMLKRLGSYGKFYLVVRRQVSLPLFIYMSLSLRQNCEST